MNIQKIINTDIKEKKQALMYNTQIKLFLFFGIIGIIITTLKYKNILIFFIQFVIYYFIIEEIRCKIYGGCILSSWMITIVSIISIIILILDYFHLFKDLKNKIQSLQSKYKKFIPDKQLELII